MPANVVKSGVFGIATGSDQDIVNYFASLTYMPQVLSFSWNTLLGQYSVLFTNPGGNV